MEILFLTEGPVGQRFPQDEKPLSPTDTYRLAWTSAGQATSPTAPVSIRVRLTIMSSGLV
jgi:hypothetical protein